MIFLHITQDQEAFQDTSGLFAYNTRSENFLGLTLQNNNLLTRPLEISTKKLSISCQFNTLEDAG